MSKVKRVQKCMLSLVVGAFILLLLSPFSYGEEAKYRYEKIDGEWWAFLGEDKYKWEPQPWMQPALLKEGLAFYDRWRFPNEAAPEVARNPWDTGMEEREKLTGREIYLKHIELTLAMQTEDFQGDWGGRITDPRGRWRDKFGIEWARSYRHWPELLPDDVKDKPYAKTLQKLIIILTVPEDVKGTGILSYAYNSPERKDDLWLYLPSVRKVRRVSTGSRQDRLWGTVFFAEEITQMTPVLHDYKILRSEIHKRREGVYGYGENEPDDKRVLPGFNSQGNPHWVIECAPSPKRWWFAKRLMWIDKVTYSMSHSEAYDKEGKKIRTRQSRYVWIQPFSEKHTGKKFTPAQYHYTSPSHWMGHELLTGYKSYWFGWYHNTYDVGFSDGILATRTLLAEPLTLTYGKR